MLVDLGTLDYKEQSYWKGFNIAPPHKGCLSYTAYQRWIKGAWCNPVSLILYLSRNINRLIKNGMKNTVGFCFFL